MTQLTLLIFPSIHWGRCLSKNPKFKNLLKSNPYVRCFFFKALFETWKGSVGNGWEISWKASGILIVNGFFSSPRLLVTSPEKNDFREHLTLTMNSKRNKEGTMVKTVSGFTHNYLKPVPRLLGKTGLCTQILCSFLLCSWQAFFRLRVWPLLQKGHLLILSL